ncbi:FKBP-type peptidyl-prolyl cis-trans isomerase [Chitinophagales bacterium]|nr:FKBP-type peptidyl-prolyl cis-trans isomerase [Chitinophagales bacterium]
MKIVSTVFMSLFLVLLASCGGASEGATAAVTAGSSMKETTGSNEAGLEYTIYSEATADAPRAKMGDHLTMFLETRTQNDSTIFSSYKRNKPVSFTFSKTLFRGVVNDGIALMAKGDSARFSFPAELMYKQNIPKFLKPGEKLVYIVKLDDIRDAGEVRSQGRAKIPAQR